MSLGSAEKQKIIMQISAVQTDIKRTLDERFPFFITYLHLNVYLDRNTILKSNNRKLVYFSCFINLFLPSIHFIFNVYSSLI